jgi:hypothetical protein
MDLGRYRVIDNVLFCFPIGFWNVTCMMGTLPFSSGEKNCSLVLVAMVPVNV